MAFFLQTCQQVNLEKLVAEYMNDELQPTCHNTPITYEIYEQSVGHINDQMYKCTTCNDNTYSSNTSGSYASSSYTAINSQSADTSVSEISQRGIDFHALSQER